MTEVILSSDIYTPPNTFTLANAPTDSQIRLGIQGYPKLGKTWGALTFPNPIVLNLDRGLGAHVGRTDVIDVPMYNPSFVDGIVKRDTNPLAPPNRKDAVQVWLAKEASKLTTAQTLIIDSNTQLQNAFVAQYNLHPRVTKQGKVDDFGLWAEKVSYYNEICEQLKLLRCNVIFIVHETQARDDSGDLTNGVRPLLTGQFGDQIGGHFTDWFRAIAIGKPTDATKAKFKSDYSLTDSDVEEWIKSTPEVCKTIYLWQTTSDSIAKCGSSTLVGAPKFILANYQSFSKYRRKNK